MEEQLYGQPLLDELEKEEYIYNNKYSQLRNTDDPDIKEFKDLYHSWLINLFNRLDDIRNEKTILEHKGLAQFGILYKKGKQVDYKPMKVSYGTIYVSNGTAASTPADLARKLNCEIRVENRAAWYDQGEVVMSDINYWTGEKGQLHRS